VVPVIPDDDVPIEALESVDLELPLEYEDELFAGELLENLAGYHKSELARRAARHQGDSASAEKLARQAAVCRTAAALIQHEHPATRLLYRDIAVAKATQAKRARAELLGEAD
jgi:hypothetical protein